MVSITEKCFFVSLYVRLMVRILLRSGHGCQGSVALLDLSGVAEYGID